MSTLHIDWTRCRGRGGCIELLAELIGRDELGYPVAATNTLVPRALQRHAQQAVRDCPRLALSLVEDHDRNRSRQFLPDSYPSRGAGDAHHSRG